jgi:hypothetical protein
VRQLGLSDRLDDGAIKSLADNPQIPAALVLMALLEPRLIAIVNLFHRFAKLCGLGAGRRLFLLGLEVDRIRPRRLSPKPTQ